MILSIKYIRSIDWPNVWFNVNKVLALSSSFILCFYVFVFMTDYSKEHKWLITAGLLCLSIVLLLLPSVMNESDNNWIKETEERCNSSCNDINMTMLMISDELQCVCTSETPGVRSYPWKG